jgi:glycosyltransferase involved in cell wall biosynthesis
MQFAFVRNRQCRWGGDLKAVQDLSRGLQALGHESSITTDVHHALSADQICFVGTAAVDHDPEMFFMQMMQRDYSCIPFHEDELLFSGASYGFLYYVSGILENKTENNHRFSIESLIERPHLVFYFDKMKTVNALMNYDFLNNARLVLAESPTEAATLIRDVPNCQPRILKWAPGFAEDVRESPNDSFLKWTGLATGSYLLQVGRLSLRKNQLATLLATRDLDIPVVFIAMGKSTPVYEKAFFATASLERKAPILFISQNPALPSPNIRFIPTQNGELLSSELLLSAFRHAGLHFHPAFYELPGYTYLESARFGTPTIASKWGSLRDYFTDDAGRYTMDERIEYALPYDLKDLKRLIRKKFGQRFPENPLHPMFARTAIDVAKDFLQLALLNKKP